MALSSDSTEICVMTKIIILHKVFYVLQKIRWHFCGGYSFQPQSPIFLSVVGKKAQKIFLQSVVRVKAQKIIVNFADIAGDRGFHPIESAGGGLFVQVYLSAEDHITHGETDNDADKK